MKIFAKSRLISHNLAYLSTHNLQIQLFCEMKFKNFKLDAKKKALLEEEDTDLRFDFANQDKVTVPPQNLKNFYKVRDYSKIDPKAKHNLVFHTEPKNKSGMEKLVNKMLNDELITPEFSENFKTTVRKSTYGMKYENVTRLSDPSYIESIWHDWMDLRYASCSLENYMKLYNHQIEQRKYKNPMFDIIDRLERPLIDGADEKDVQKKSFKWLPHNITKKPNAEDPTAQSRVSRINMNYNYNFEQHKTYTRELEIARKKDAEKVESEDKLLAYLKTNPNSHFSRNYIPKMAVPYEKLKYPVDAATNKLYLDWVPEKSKRERRKIVPKHSIELKGYDSWRSFDKQISYIKNYHDNSKRIFISPTKLIKVSIFINMTSRDLVSLVNVLKMI